MIWRKHNPKQYVVDAEADLAEISRPRTGSFAFAMDEGTTWVFDGAAWGELGAGGSSEPAAEMGFQHRAVADDQIISAGDIGDLVLGNQLAVTGDADSWYDAEDPGSPWNLPPGLYLAQFHLYLYDNEGAGATEATVECLPLDRVESSIVLPIESNGAIQTEPVAIMFYTDFLYVGAFIVRVHATGAHDIGVGAFNDRSWVRLAKLA